MPRRVVVTDYTFPELAAEHAAATEEGAEFTALQCKTADDVAGAVRGADVAVVQFAPLTARAIDGLAEGAAILRYGIGFDNIDVAAANARGIPVGYVPDYCIDEVADHTVALILAQLRKLLPLDQSVRAGRWAAVAIAQPLLAYSETVIGFLGLGQIGRAVLERLRPSGFGFLVADPALDEAAATRLGVTVVDAETLVERADVLSLHVPATPQTTHFIGAARLARMKPTAFLVNTARGALVDESALAAALNNGTIGGAALDVFETEPLPENSPLRNAPNLILSPHAAWYSASAITRLQQLVADDIATWLRDGMLRKPVPGSNVKARGRQYAR
jgi:D-3-phosphoglycerate dehydrogenase / 2-oxoglutarate reductase